jgi:hypothetical protein
MTMKIEANIAPQFMEHFKSQLLCLEVRGHETDVLYDGGGHQDRHELMLELVKRSFFDFPTTKPARFWIFTGDNRPADAVNGEPLYSISGPRLSHEFVIPDPYILRWPLSKVEDFRKYTDTMREMSHVPPERKSFVWRGMTLQNPIRKIIVDKCLESQSKIFDVKDVSLESNKEDFVEMKDLTKWAGMIDFPGQGFSGRLKYLLHLNRPAIVFQRIDWDSTTILLEPGVHYYFCPNDFQVMSYLSQSILDNYEMCLRMSFSASTLISKITQRNNVSNQLVRKILRYV